MGWINRIKSFFSEAKEEKQRQASLGEFEAWLKEIRLARLSSVNKQLHAYKNRIEEQKSLIVAATEVLRKAELQNPHIPSRALHLMQGNREAYIRITGRLAESMAAPSKYEELEYFIAKWDNGFEEALKSTQRSYFVMQEFFSNESKEIAKQMKGMDSIVNELREFVRKEGFELIISIEKHLESIKAAMHLIAEQDDKIKELHSFTKEEEQKKAFAEKAMAKIKESDRFKKFLGFEEQKADIQSKISVLDNDLRHDFSAIEPSLKRFEHVSTEEVLIRNYLADPAKAVMEDSMLKIIEVLAVMKKAMDEGSVEMKDRKKDKAAEIMQKLNAESLESFRKKKNELLTDSEKIEAESQAYDDMPLVNSELAKQKDAVRKISELQQRTKEVEAEKAKIDLNSHIKKVQELTFELDQTKLMLTI